MIRGVEGMNFADIEKTINELGEKVRDASVKMGRGYFTANGTANRNSISLFS